MARAVGDTGQATVLEAVAVKRLLKVARLERFGV